MPVAAQADTIGFWKFNEKAAGQQTAGTAGEILDSSGNGYHGTATGDATTRPYYRTGVGMDSHNTALELKRVGTGEYGDPAPANEDWVEAPSNSAFDLMFANLTDYTIEAYIKAPQITGISQGGTIFTHRGSATAGNGNGWSFRLSCNTATPGDTSGGKLGLYVEATSAHSLNFLYPDAKGSVQIDDGLWHHVAAVIDTNADRNLTGVKFYVDYQLDSTVLFKDVVYNKSAGNTWYNDNCTSAGKEYIGTFVSGTTIINRNCDQLVGDIDMVRFSTGALTPDQFVQIPEPTTLVLLFTGLIGLLAYAWRKRR